MFLIWHIILQFNYILQAIYYQVFDLKKFIQKAKNEQKAKNGATNGRPYNV